MTATHLGSATRKIGKIVVVDTMIVSERAEAADGTSPENRGMIHETDVTTQEEESRSKNTLEKRENVTDPSQEIGLSAGQSGVHHAMEGESGTRRKSVGTEVETAIDIGTMIGKEGDTATGTEVGTAIDHVEVRPLVLLIAQRKGEC